MIIAQNIVQSSVARWARRSKAKPGDLARAIGEGRRAGQTTAEQRERRYASMLAQTRSALAARSALERILGGNDLVGINFLELGSRSARSVCRIHLRNANGETVGFGTGSLVGPGVLLTNHHVIASADQARFASAEFDYEYDWQGNDKPKAVFSVLADPAPIALQGLDFCLAAVARQSQDGKRALDEFGWLPLNAAPGKAFVGEYLTIIQHPGGERKQVCVRENKLLKYDEGGNTIWYMTDTVAGSSGSPVFNGSWQVVALHHSGVPKTDSKGRWLTVDKRVWDSSMDESLIAWEANEGIRISRILEYLRSNAVGHPLAAAVLGSSAAVARPVPQPDREGNAGSSVFNPQDGELRVTIPVQISVRVGDVGRKPDQAGSAPVPFAASSSKPVVAPLGTEAVTVDQSDYAARTGYRKNFLGSGALEVPLPRVKKEASILHWKTGPAKKSELKYWNYSVVMNKDRKLAFFSAVNVDANLRPTSGGREGDRWYYDTRIADKKLQLGPEFYAEQREFEMDRTYNPFDRGHLTRRLDAQWGHDEEETKRNGDDSFHWTNCSPQHWQFNQGKKKWLGLEDYVIKGFASRTERACVINGPVFDAPLSRIGPNGRPIPNFTGSPHKDPRFGGVAIPKLFFKVVACESGTGRLAAAAFLMSQEDLLRHVDRIQGMGAVSGEESLTDAEARLYQVSVVDLGRLTNLDFGPLAEADTASSNEAFRAAIPEPLQRLEDIRLR